MPEKRIMALGNTFGERTADEFLGREKELAFLRGAANLLQKGISSCIIVSGLPGIGKSELLRQAADACLEMEGEPLPIYLSFSSGAADPWAGIDGQIRLAISAACGGAADTSAAVLDKLGRGANVCAETVGRLVAQEDNHRHKAETLAEAIGAAASKMRRRLIVFLDDADLLGITGLPALLTSSAARAGRVSLSWVLAARRGSDLAGCSELPVRQLSLGPIPGQVSGDLLAFYMARSGVAFFRECLPAAFLLSGIPGLIREAASSASLAGVVSFEHPEAFIRFYADELSSGFLHEYHRVLLGGATDGGRTTLELLLYLSRSPGGFSEVGTAAREMLKDEEELAPAIRNLTRLGLIENHWERISAYIPSTLADFCRLESRRFLEGCSMEEAKARLFMEKVSALSRVAATDQAARNAFELADFLHSWQGQQVPKALMEWERFGEISRSEGILTTEKLITSDKSRLILPRIVDAWPERFPGNDQVHPYSIDLLALALAEKSGDERWLAVDIRLGEREVTSTMVADFVRRCRIFQNRAGLGAGMLKGWVVSGGGFSAEALESMRKLSFWSCGPEQLRLMAAMTGWAGAVKLTLPTAELAEEPRVFELVIPAVDETELVAAKALEQVGQGLPLAEGEIGKVKMALVEACINAFEHGGSEERKVHITFKVGSSSLEIEVFNRGRSFIPGRIVKPTIEDKMASPRKRGWGLSLIKELMDDIEFVQKEDGTLLRMVKYFKGRPGEERHA